MRLLFIKHSLAWPRSSGHDVHTYYMMKACAELGHEVSLATAVAPSADGVRGLTLEKSYLLEGHRLKGPVAASWLQKRYRNFYGVPDERIAGAAEAAVDSRADAAIVVGLDVLPFFPALSGVARVWYAADEWILHHLSQIKRRDPQNRENVRDAIVKGLYERAHRRVIDRVWVVSESERRAMRWLAGMRHVDVIPNGVDGEQFSPGNEPVDPDTAVFWGRLDFGPNVQALQWFCGRVWPQVRREVPHARFTIIGFRPTEAVRRLASIEGVTLIPDLPDLRGAVRRHASVVLPFVSGGGIKNKLLEAAALGRAIVCTRAATQGLRGAESAPLLIPQDEAGFARELVELWRNPQRQSELGLRAREWVLEHHTWRAAARQAVATLGVHANTTERR